MADLETETRHLRANRTPLDILAMIDSYAYDSDEQRRMFAAGLIATYGQDCAARPEWQPVEPKPADWDTAYPVTLTGKNLEAMSYLSRFVLAAVKEPHPLPFGVVGAADHLFCLAAALRALT